MQIAATPLLTPWQSFYVIVGSSGAALTGLQFIVITLVYARRIPSSHIQIDAFGTPTIVHFCAALLVAQVLSAPWHALSSVALALGACGLAGVGYIGLVVWRARRQSAYRLVLEDWIWHASLPFVAYASLLSAAFVLGEYPHAALFAIAATAMLLLFIGIHNAWDTVTYITVADLGKGREGENRE